MEVPLQFVRITLNLQIMISRKCFHIKIPACLPWSVITGKRRRESTGHSFFILFCVPPLPCARLNLSRNFFARALTLLVFARCPGSLIISPGTHGRGRLGLSLGKVTEYPCLTLLFCKLTYAPVMHNLSLDRLTQIFKCKCPFLRIPDASHLPH